MCDHKMLTERLNARKDEMGESRLGCVKFDFDQINRSKMIKFD